MAIIIRPENIATSRPSVLVEQAIMALGGGEVDVIGVDQAIFLACSTVKLASDLSSIGIKEIAIDYYVDPIRGKSEGIFFTLSMDEQPDMGAKTERMDSGMVLELGPEGQVITVPKLERSTRLAIMALMKLRKFDKIKIMGAGGAMTSAVSVALLLSKGKLAKEPVGIEAITLAPVPARDEAGKPTTGINIYLVKGSTTGYSDHHKELIRDLETGKL